MKKNLLFTVSAASAALVLSLTALSAPVEPVRTLEIPKACFAPALDGVAEDVYSEVQTTEVFNATGLEGDADFTASFQVCWDINYLYVYAEILDDIDHSYEWTVGNPWEFDNLELFLQLDTNTVTTSYGTTTIQLRVCRNLDSVETAGRAPRTDYGYYMEGSAAGGWITEVAVPWTAVLETGSVPEDMMDYVSNVIGFDFSGADSDNSDGDATVGNRDVQSAWDSDDPDDAADRTEDLAWNNTSVFGYVTLQDLDCTPIGIEEYRDEARIQTVPNPAGDMIRLLDVDQAGSLVIYNMQGAAVLVKEYQPNEDVDISGLKSGIYSVVLNGTTSGRFVKQ